MIHIENISKLEQETASSRRGFLKGMLGASAFVLSVRWMPEQVFAASTVPNSSAAEAMGKAAWQPSVRSEEHTSELQSQSNLVCRLLLEKKQTLSHIYPPTAHSTPTCAPSTSPGVTSTLLLTSYLPAPCSASRRY